ncbi:hypothetical protein [Nocardioides sp.]|uniref:hypothetical protein n=1 Tax=Nocardioides sp. TaxID=35761 RepID=UPI0035B2FF4E
MRPLFSSGRYAAVTSTVALVVALGGGTAYAAGLITSKDIKDGGVKRVDLASGAVDSAKVADGTLAARDFRAGQLPAGPQGPAGARGPAGPQGPAGPAGTGGELELVYVRTGPLGADVGVTEVYLFCPDGLSPTGGGIASGGSTTALGMHGSFPFDDSWAGPDGDGDNIPDNGWAVEVNNDGTAGTVFAAYAVCGSATYVADQYVIVTPTQTTSRTTSEGTRIVARPGR